MLAQMKKGKGKENALHMVQVLPLEDSPKFFVVHVSHTETSHECCLTASMWQQTFGPHELFACMEPLTDNMFVFWLMMVQLITS